MAALIAGPGSFQIVCIAGKTFHKLRFTFIRGNLIERMILCIVNDSVSKRSPWLEIKIFTYNGILIIWSAQPLSQFFVEDGREHHHLGCIQPGNNMQGIISFRDRIVLLPGILHLAKITLFSCPL